MRAEWRAARVERATRVLALSGVRPHEGGQAVTVSGARPVGLGAMPDGEKTAFRVWAPHARRVAVIGSFNGWDFGRDPMEPEGEGYWYAEIVGARSPRTCGTTRR